MTMQITMDYQEYLDLKNKHLAEVNALATALRNAQARTKDAVDAEKALDKIRPLIEEHEWSGQDMREELGKIFGEYDGGGA